MVESINSLDQYNYQNIIDEVKASSTTLMSFGIDMNNLERALEKVSQCALLVKEISEKPSVQAHVQKQQAKDRVLNTTLELENLNEHKANLINDTNMKKDELQKLEAEHHQLQNRVREISDKIKILREEITTSEQSLEISALTQADLQTTLDESRTQLAKAQGGDSDDSHIALFTSLLGRLEKAKESCAQIFKY